MSDFWGDIEKLRKCTRYSVFREESARMKGRRLDWKYMSKEWPYRPPIPGPYEKRMPMIFKAVLRRTERDPVVMFERVMEDLRRRWEGMPLHGPWHHAILPGVLIASLRNNGYSFTDEDVMEAMFRGHLIPAASCGFLGVCGCAVGVGIMVSMIRGSTPLHDRERADSLIHAGEAIKRIGRMGSGPLGHCCNKSALLSIIYAVNVLDKFGYSIPHPKPKEMVGRCRIADLNERCHREKCMFYPGLIDNRDSGFNG